MDTTLTGNHDETSPPRRERLSGRTFPCTGAAPWIPGGINSVEKRRKISLGFYETVSTLKSPISKVWSARCRARRHIPFPRYHVRGWENNDARSKISVDYSLSALPTVRAVDCYPVVRLRRSASGYGRVSAARPTRDGERARQRVGGEISKKRKRDGTSGRTGRSGGGVDRMRGRVRSVIALRGDRITPRRHVCELYAARVYHAYTHMRSLSLSPLV